MFEDYVLCNSQRFGVQILYRFYMMCSVLLLLLFAHFSGSFKKRNSIFFVNMIFQMPFLYTEELKESSNQLSPLGGSTDYLSLLKTEGSRAIQGPGRIQSIMVCFCVHLLAILSHCTCAINVLKLNHSQHQ